MTKKVSLWFVRFALAAFFVILGIAGILPEFEEAFFTFPGGFRWLEITFGVIELLCGAYLFIGSFVTFPKNTTFAASFIVLIAWLVRIVLTRVIWGIVFSDSGIFFKPNIVAWTIALTTELVIAAALGLFLKANES